MIHDHGQPAALGLQALAHAVHDVGVDAGQVPADQRGEVIGGQPRTRAGEELVGAVPAQVHDRIGTELAIQPVVEGQVLMRRREGQVGVQQFLAHAPATRRLRADVDVAELQARHQELVVMGHDPARRLAPAVQAGHAGLAKGAHQLPRARPIARTQRFLDRGFQLVE